MGNLKRVVSLVMSLLIVISTFSVQVYADDPPAPAPLTADMINISSDWEGSVFGDVGGQNRIERENFEITEHGDGTVTLRSSNDRGKIASGNEGIAYYFKEMAADADYELTATAHVDAWTANNQVAFGIMARSNVAYNVSDSSITGDYAAVGALDQTMKGFHKQNGTQQKSGYEFTADAPAVGKTYELSLKKSGDTYLIRIDDELHEFVNNGSMNYVGLFTARNTTVTFSNIQLHVKPTQTYDDWTFAAFGDNTSPARNPEPTIHPDGEVTLTTSGGKIASDQEGISFYYTEVPADANFELSAKASVISFNENSGISTPNQKSFGLMLKDEIAEHGNSTKHTSNYVATGALDTVMKAFYKVVGVSEQNIKLPPYAVDAPAAGEVYDLSIRKTGDAYVMTVNGQSESIVQSNIFGGTIYVGFYAARDAQVMFSDFKVIADERAAHSIKADPAHMKKTLYLIGENLDLTGLRVQAVTDDVYGHPRTEWLASNEYVVTGFDSSEPGVNTITVHFNGLNDQVDLEVIPLTVTDLRIVYYPAKTVYYPGDKFDPQGLTLFAAYNSGISGHLTPDKYTFSIPGASITDDVYTFPLPGSYTVRVISTETPARQVTFDVEVKDAELVSLDIRQAPSRLQYFLGDELDLGGMIVYAIYDDGSEVRLLRSDYTASGFDASTPGEKRITIEYNGRTAAFLVHVKEKEVTHIEVSQYPKTTYAVGESFDRTGMEVAKVYDNGLREPYAHYTLDDSAFDGTMPGVYDIMIIPNDAELAPIALPVTVREQQEYSWQAIRFGQSTSDANNKVTILEDGTIRLEALGGSAGKITGDHDGLSYYYTVIDGETDNFVLSANIKVIEYAKESHDGQESFGMMARDAIGTPGDSSVFASNFAAVGGYSGGTRNDNGTQLFARTGVEAPDATGSQGVQSVMLKNERPGPDNTHPQAEYRLTLAKTNSGFVGRLNDEPEKIIYEPDILTVQDSNIYIGFYAARLATIEVSDIEFAVTAATTDAPKVEPPPEAVTPNVEILSLSRTSEPDYVFRARANADGTITLKQGQDTIAQDIAAEAGEVLSIPARLRMNGETHFSMTFIPDDSQYLTSYDKIVTNFTVQVRSYRNGGDIYVSPTGKASGDGSLADPLDLDTAIDFVMPGQKIMMLDGRYVRNSSLEIKKYNDGREDEMKMLFAAEGARPIIDFAKQSEGVVHSGSYWHVKGIDFTRSADNTKGYTIGGSHNVIELSRFYANGDTGLQISRTDVTSNDIADWPSYNLILNNESFDNADPSHNNADGFAAKLTSGVGNVFRGNIAHHNIDDGWDLYTKAGQGAIGPVIIEDSIAYRNGMLTDGTVGDGDKNGFKLGGEGIHVPHIIRNSIAFENGAAGFTNNSNPGVIAEDNISFNNGGSNLSFTMYTGAVPDFTLNGFISYRTEGNARDNYPAGLRSNSNYLFDGTRSVNAAGVELSDDNFASLEPVLPFARDEEGNLLLGDFLRFIPPVNEPDDEEEVSGGSGGSRTYRPSPGNQPGDITAGADGSVTVGANVSTAHDGTALVSIGESAMRTALDRAETGADGLKRIRIDAASASAEAYAISMPSFAFGSDAGDLLLEIRIGALTITLPGNMFKQVAAADASDVTFHIRVLASSEHGVAAVGDRPVYEFRIAAGDEEIVWNNPDAPVRVEIPYTLSDDEPEHEFIVVWYVGKDREIVPITNGKYVERTRSVVFTTDHFSQFAVTYDHKTFEDIAGFPWAKHEIEVLAAKGIVEGVSGTAFAPEDTLTRADFTLLLVRLFELRLAEGESSASPFADVHAGDYYEEGVRIASAYGIVNGTGDGNFRPRDSMTRQDMFAAAARALQAAGMWEAYADAQYDLSIFSDYGRIAPYAAEAIEALAQAGLIRGDGASLRPLDTVTRAEAAVLIYRLYNAR